MLARAITTQQLFKTEDKADFVKLDTLNDVPKVKYSYHTCMAVYPENPRMKKMVYSHTEIAKMVERNANKIRELGVKPREAVALVIPNGVEAAIMFMSLQWAAVIAVPIDPNLPFDLIKRVVTDTKCRVIVSPVPDEEEKEEDELYNNVEKFSKESGIISWHSFFTRNSGVDFESHGVRAAPFAAWHEGNKDLTLDPREVALRVVVPLKGKNLVLSLRQEDYCYAIRSFAEAYELEEGSMTVLSSPVYSLQGLLVMMAVLYTGGGIVIQAGGTFSPALFWNNVKDDKVSWASLTSSQLLALAEITRDDNVKITPAMKLKFVRSCPGFLPKSEVTEIEKILQCPVLEAYGPPEASGTATGNTLSAKKLGTLGKPLKGVDVGVFDLVTKERKGANERGFIAVRGENVVDSGYDNDPEECKASMWWDEEDQSELGKNRVWLFTGDEGVFDDDGFLTVYFQQDRQMSKGYLAATALKEMEEEEERKRLAAEEEERQRLAAVAAQKEKEEEEERARAMVVPVVAPIPVSEPEPAPAPAPAAAPAAASEPTKASSRSVSRSRALGTAAGVGVGVAGLAGIQQIVEEMEEKDRATKEEYTKAMEERMEQEKQWREEYEAKIAQQQKDIEAMIVANGAADMGFGAVLLARLQALEEKQKELSEALGATADPEREATLKAMEAEKKRAEDASRAARAAAIGVAGAPLVMEVNMDEVEMAAISAAAAAEEAKKNTDIAAAAAEESAMYVSEATIASKKAAEAATAAALAAAALAELSEQVSRRPLPIKETIIREKLPEPKPDSSVVERSVAINLEDIDQAVKSHPAVTDAMAFGKLDERYGMDVYCACVIRKGARVSEGWLRLHTQTVLPAAMIPKKFYLVDTLPKERQALTDCEDIMKEYSIEKTSKQQMIRNPTYKKHEGEDPAGAAPVGADATGAPAIAPPPPAAPAAAA